MSVVVQLCSGEGVGVKGDRVDFIVGESDGEDASDGVVRGIGLYCDRSIRGSVNEHRCRGECIFQVEEGLPTVIEEVPRNSFSGKVGESDHNV